MSDTQLNTFPSNRFEALTMLYLQNQDLSNLTPSELSQKYIEVLKEIKKSYSNGNKQEARY